MVTPAARLHAGTLATAALGVAAMMAPLLATERMVAFWSAGLLGFHLGAFSLMHALVGASRGANVLGMFTMTVAAAILVHGWFLPFGTLYLWATTLIGATALLISAYDTIESPPDRRGTDMGPRSGF